jgi:ribosome biogenesis protein ERB1
LLWYDLDLSDTPYKTLEYHSKAINQCAFSKAYPLMATASNDGTVHVLHAKVFTDLLQNALIVPLKILKGHTIKDGEGVK